MTSERICQCCGMPTPTDDLLGYFPDGRKNQDYCLYCFKEGRFNTASMEEQIRSNVAYLEQFNRDAGTNMTVEEAKATMAEFFPTLKRWMPLMDKAEWVLNHSDNVILCSLTEDGYPRPVALSLVESRGLLEVWMVTFASSIKAGNFRNDPRAGMSIVRGNDSITMTGTVDVIDDENLKREIWKDYFTMYFKDPDDPEYCPLRFNARDAALWIDGELNRMSF